MQIYDCILKVSSGFIFLRLCWFIWQRPHNNRLEIHFLLSKNWLFNQIYLPDDFYLVELIAPMSSCVISTFYDYNSCISWKNQIIFGFLCFKNFWPDCNCWCFTDDHKSSTVCLLKTFFTVRIMWRTKRIGSQPLQQIWIFNHHWRTKSSTNDLQLFLLKIFLLQIWKKCQKLTYLHVFTWKSSCIPQPIK